MKGTHVNAQIEEHLRKVFKERDVILWDHLIIILNCEQYLYIMHFHQLESKEGKKQNPGKTWISVNMKMCNNM